MQPAGSPPATVFYYGLELPPDARKARELAAARVVLQPTHPLVVEGSFRDFFPQAALFVYWNPTAVQFEELRRLESDLPLTSFDARWKLARIDLATEAGRTFAVAAALRALAVGGAQVSGLFVDDLDLWSAGERRRSALAVLSELALRARQDYTLFLNRAFPLWKDVANMEAVLLEELSPSAVDRLLPQDQEWVRRMVLPHVRKARKAGVFVASIDYAPASGSQPTSRASSELAAVVHDTLTLSRALDQWPEELQ